MEGSTQAIICGTLSSILAGWIIVDIYNLRRMRAPGFAPIAMDGATCLKTRDNRIVIKPRTLMNWLALIILGAFEIGFIALIAAALLSGKGISGRLGTGCAGIILVGVALFAAARFSRRPLICLDTNTRLLTVGRGAHARQIPFSKVSRVEASSTGTGIARIYRSHILATLTDGETIALGSVSGEGQRMVTTTKAILELIKNALETEPQVADA